jgi:hypothetical protein
VCIFKELLKPVSLKQLEMLKFLSFLLFLFGIHAHESNKIVLLQYFNSKSTFYQLNWIEKSSFLNVYNYCQRYHYDYHIITINQTFFLQEIKLHESWVKVFALHSFLQRETTLETVETEDSRSFPFSSYDYVVYLDSDYFFTNFQISLINQMQQHWSKLSDIVLTSSQNPTISRSPGTEVMIFKNHYLNRERIQEWVNSALDIRNRDLQLDQEDYFYHDSNLQSLLATCDPQRIFLVSPTTTTESTKFASFVKNYTLLKESSFLTKCLSSGSKDSLGNSNINLSQSQKSNFQTEKEEEGEAAFNRSLFSLNEFEHFEEFPLFWIPITMTFRDIPLQMNVFYHNSDLSFLPSSLKQIPEITDEEIDEVLEQTRFIQNERATAVMIVGQRLKKEKLLAIAADVAATTAAAAVEVNKEEKEECDSIRRRNKNLQSSYSKTIVTVFAGRKDRLDILIRYLSLALDYNIIQEVHLWDYARTAEDSINLLSYRNNDQGIFIKSRYTLRKGWYDYYEFYADYAIMNPFDIIIKCDDDIVFIDIFKLPYFIDVLRREEESDDEGGESQEEKQKSFLSHYPIINGVLLANVINNGVTTYYQQKVFGIIPPPSDTSSSSSPSSSSPLIIDDYEYPVNGLCGSLWSSGTKANHLHTYFLQNWKNLIRLSPSAADAAATTTTTTNQSVFLSSLSSDLVEEEYTSFCQKMSRKNESVKDSLLFQRYQPEFLQLQSRFSINFFGIKARNWYKIKNSAIDDEMFISEILPVFVPNSYNYLLSNFIVSHFTFGSQTHGFNESEKLQEYHQVYIEYVEKYKNDLSCLY